MIYPVPNIHTYNPLRVPSYTPLSWNYHSWALNRSVAVQSIWYEGAEKCAVSRFINCTLRPILSEYRATEKCHMNMKFCLENLKEITSKTWVCGRIILKWIWNILDPSHWQQGQALCSCEHSNGPYCSVVSHSAIQCNITTKGVRKVTPPVCIFTPRQGIEMKRKTKYSSVCVLWLCSSLFHVAPRHTQRRQRWTSFANLSLFDCPGSPVYHFIACDMNSSSNKQPEARRGQIRAVGGV
jgi:hypothetical protein